MYTRPVISKRNFHLLEPTEKKAELLLYIAIAYLPFDL